MQAQFRFAPSPNGYLHLGHAYSALLNERFAQAHAGRLLLRIEDIDQGRSRSTYVEGLYEDLAWLGLRFAEPIRVQSDYFELYRTQADLLKKRGLLYPCSCTRNQIKQRAKGQAGEVDPDGVPLYAGACREGHPATDQPLAWRLDMRKALQAVEEPLVIRCFDAQGQFYERPAQPALWGDVVLVRKDTPTSYHLSVVLDDAAQDITHIVRGRDLEQATDLHRLLQALLGLPSPVYHHHALIEDEQGDKLSKSKLSKPLRQWRAEGETGQTIRHRLGFI